MKKCKLLLFVLFLLINSFLFSGKVFSQSGKDYIINPFNFSLESGKKYIPPKIIRPLRTSKYLFELWNERGLSDDFGYLSAKRIEILYELGNSAKIVGNYKDLESLLKWKDKMWPKKYEFWRFSEEDSWEASLAEYYQLTSLMIENIDKNNSETEKTKDLIDMAAVIFQQKEKIEYRISSLQKKPEEKLYLSSISKDIFSSLQEKYITRISPDKDYLYQFSVLPLINKKDVGNYFVWLDLPDPLADNNDVTLVYRDTKLIVTGSKNSKNVLIGKLTIDDKNEWIKLKFSKNFIKGENNVGFKLYLKNDENSEKINVSPNGKNKSSFVLSIIKIFVVLTLIIILSAVFNKKIKLILKLVANSRFGFIDFLQKITPLIICCFVLSIIVVSDNVEMIIIRSFIFWTIIAVVWNIYSGITFFGAFILLLLCPYLIARKNKEDLAETYAIIAYFLFISGTIQIALQDFFKNKKFNKSNFFKGTVIFLTTTIIGFIFYKLIITFRSELNYYSYYFGNEFVYEFKNRFYLKIPILSGLLIVLYLLIFIYSKKLRFKINIVDNILDLILPYLLLIITLTSFLQISRYLLFRERKEFMNKPIILSVVPDHAFIGEEVKIIGKSFLDQSKKGKVLLNGQEQNVAVWDDETIVFKVDENLSTSGDLVVSNQYGEKKTWTNSNEIDFIIEGLDYTAPASKSF